MRISWRLSLLVLLLWQCQPVEEQPSPSSLFDQIVDAPSLEGRKEYANTPYVTAGDRLYMVGHQNGQFPDLGWHVKGEMGGIWDHPIKLMDGFTAQIQMADQTVCLNNADQFTNYPFGNTLRYTDPIPQLEVTQFQFVPDSTEAIAIEYTFENNAPEEQSFTFIWNGMVDLRPVWLGERTGMMDGPDQISWDAGNNCLIAKDSLQEWYTAWGSTLEPASHAIGSGSCDFERLGLGANGALQFDVTVPANGRFRLPLVVAGSYLSKAAAIATLKEVQNNVASLLETKRHRMGQLANQAKVTIPDKNIQQAYEWVKYNTDWLIRDVPEVGRGLSAGIPDYPWWFGCDNTYTLQGVLATGRTDIAYSTLDLLLKLSAETNGNGRIIHEASTNGVVFNPGNINETPHFASMVWTMYEWTGDQEWLARFYPTVKDGLSWLLKENDDDGNLCPDGFGMMEIHGLDSEMIDVAVYTQQAFADAAKMATLFEETQQAKRYTNIATQLKDRINTAFWVPEFNSYADFIGTTEQALHLIDDAIVRADTLGKPWAVAELQATKAQIADYPKNKKQGFVLYHNWVVNTPMEVGIADPEKALPALETGSQFVNPFGVFVTGIDRDESAGSDEGSFAAKKTIFSYVGAVMTLPTGVQAIAENNYGRPDEALRYLQRMVRSFNYALPGSMYEVSPDFGMMTQAWNTYALAVPLVQQFFGIQPQAYNQTILLQPQFPSNWDNADLKDLPIADNMIGLTMDREDDTLKLSFTQEKEWKVVLRFQNGKYQEWQVNGQVVQPTAGARWDEFTVTAQTISIQLKP